MKPFIHDTLVIFFHITTGFVICSLLYSFITCLKRKNKKNILFPNSYFLLGVCIGLVLLLSIYIIGIRVEHHVYIGNDIANMDIMTLLLINLVAWMGILFTWACCHSKMEVLEDRFLHTPIFGKKKIILFSEINTDESRLVNISYKQNPFVHRFSDVYLILSLKDGTKYKFFYNSLWWDPKNDMEFIMTVRIKLKIKGELYRKTKNGYVNYTPPRSKKKYKKRNKK